MSAPPDLNELSHRDVREALEPSELMAALATPPFVYVSGTFNTRDLGLLPGGAPSTSLRPGFVFRSGNLGRLDDKGKTVLAQKLGIKRIFDVRSIQEHQTGPDPAVEGVSCVWQAPDEDEARVDVKDYIEGEGEGGYVIMYMEVLALYRPTIRAVLEHVRDRPEEPFLFHCMAGRDRTGVIAGLLLILSGASPAQVEGDYMLSRIGVEPAREQLVAFARHTAGVTSDEDPGFYNLVSLRETCWRAFVAAAEREYGGFDQYVVQTLGFAEADLARIKENLRTAPGA